LLNVKCMCWCLSGIHKLCNIIFHVDVKNVVCTRSWNIHDLTVLVFNFSPGLKFWYNNRILIQYKVSWFNISLHCRFIFHDPTQMCICIMCLSHSIHHQCASIAIATIIRVPYKNIRKPNNLSESISELLDVTKNASHSLYSYWISGYLLLKLIKFIFVKNT